MDDVKSRARLIEHFEEQLSLLEAHAESYDRGRHVTMLSAAVAIRVLFHPGRYPAVIDQLGDRDSFQFIDGVHPVTHRLIEAGTASVPGLVAGMLSPGAAPVWAPIFTAGPHWEEVSFETWWKGSVSRDSLGQNLSRRNLVLATAHKDGGAHVTLNKGEYADLPRDGFAGWWFGDPGSGSGLAPSPIPAMIRQIVEETLVGGRRYLDGIAGATA